MIYILAKKMDIPKKKKKKKKKKRTSERNLQKAERKNQTICTCILSKNSTINVVINDKLTLNLQPRNRIKTNASI